MQSLPRESVRLTVIVALWAVFAPGCHIEVTERHEGEAGAGERPGTTGGPQAGAAGEQTQGTGGTQASGGSAGAGGQTETTGGASAGGATAGAATAGAATAGAAQTSAAGAAGADTQGAGAGGIGGADETGGSVGTAGSAGAAGPDFSLCAGDTSSFTSDDPNDLVALCDGLPYGNESCDEGAAGDISAVKTMCKYVAVNGRAGVFELYYGCLSLLTADQVCSSPDLAEECRTVAFEHACRVDALVPGTEAYDCTDVQAACSDGGDPVPIAVCEGVLFGLNNDGRKNVVYCFECADPVWEGETPACIDVFTECAFPGGLGDGAYPYPGDC